MSSDMQVAPQTPPTLFISPPAKVWTKEKKFGAYRINHWLYDHPTTRKVAKAAAYVLGAALVASAALVTPVGAVIWPRRTTNPGRRRTTVSCASCRLHRPCYAGC